VKLLLDNNADVNASCGYNNSTPLKIAALRSDTEIMTLLLKDNMMGQ